MHPGNAAHLAYLRLLIERGTDEERALAKTTLAELVKVMECADEVGAGAELLPLEQVDVPHFLVERAAKVAHRRHQRVDRFRLKEKGGATRTLIDEAYSIMGQYAACLVLGLHPTSAERTHQDAKANGNLGGNVSGFTPKEGYQLLVSTTAPPTRRFVLIHREHGRRYRCIGWVRAGLVQEKRFEKTFHRQGVARTVCVVPTEELEPIATWWDG